MSERKSQGSGIAPDLFVGSRGGTGQVLAAAAAGRRESNRRAVNRIRAAVTWRGRAQRGRPGEARPCPSSSSSPGARVALGRADVSRGDASQRGVVPRRAREATPRARDVSPTGRRRRPRTMRCRRGGDRASGRRRCAARSSRGTRAGCTQPWRDAGRHRVTSAAPRRDVPAPAACRCARAASRHASIAPRAAASTPSARLLVRRLTRFGVSRPAAGGRCSRFTKSITGRD